LKSIWRGIAFWLALMTGAFSLVREAFFAYAAASGNPVSPSQTLSVLGHLSIVAFIVAGAFVWWSEHQRILTLQAAQGRLPTLDLVVRSTERPYVHEVRAEEGMFTQRWYRVGVLCDSLVRDVHVLLESCEPMSEFVFPAHALCVMGKPNRTEFVDVHPGNDPAVFVDVFTQRWDPSTPLDEVDVIHLCYVQELPSSLPSRRRRVGLRAEGGGASCHSYFVIDFDQNGVATFTPD
jgi:hypothetical protein